MAVVSVRVRAGAKHCAVVGLVDGVWLIHVSAPAVEGKANATLVRYLAEVLQVPKSSVGIRHGERSRVKAVDVAGVTQAQADGRLEQASKS